MKIGARYAIRKIGTNLFLPEPLGRNGRGGSHVEPTDPIVQEARLFVTHKGASNALSQWLRGKHYRTTYMESEGWGHLSYEVEDLPEVIHQPNRIKEEMEIVSISIVVD